MATVRTFNPNVHNLLEVQRAFQDLSILVARSTFDATSAPGVDDDITKGWKIGSRWLDVDADQLYVCVDNTEGAAVWFQHALLVIGGPGLVNYGDLTDPTPYLLCGSESENLIDEVAGIVFPAGSDGDLRFNDDVALRFGTDNDVYIDWDTSGTDYLRVEMVNDAVLKIDSTSCLTLPAGTTAQGTGITGPEGGSLRYDTDDKVLSHYNTDESGWRQIPYVGTVGSGVLPKFNTGDYDIQGMTSWTADASNNLYAVDDIDLGWGSVAPNAAFRWRTASTTYEYLALHFAVDGSESRCCAITSAGFPDVDAKAGDASALPEFRVYNHAGDAFVGMYADNVTPGDLCYIDALGYLATTGYTPPVGGPVGPHDILDGTVHTDSDTQASAEGSIIVGDGSTPSLWTALAKGTSGYFLKAGAATISWAQLTEADISDLSHFTPTDLDTDYGNETITSLFTFDRDVDKPFAVTAGSAVVPNLDSDKLDGLDAADFALVGHDHDGTYQPLDDDLTDIAAIAVSQGSLLLGDATPEWSELTIGGADTVLKSNGTTASWANVDVDELGDVNITGYGKGDILVYDSVAGEWIDLTVGTNGQMLYADDTVDHGVKWDDAPAAGGDAFTTIDCPAGTDPVASGSDTLVLATDHAGLTITGDSGTDTVTFDLVEANIDHDALSNFDANEHVDHTAVSILEGDCITVTNPTIADDVTVGISDGAIGLAKLADMTTDRLLGRNTALSGAVEELICTSGIGFTTAEPGGIQLAIDSMSVGAGGEDVDLVAIYDNSASTHKRLTLAQVLAVQHNHTESDITDLDHYDSADFATDFAAADLADIGAAELVDLNDVTTAAQTNHFAIMSDGGNYYGRAIVEADISDLDHFVATDLGITEDRIAVGAADGSIEDSPVSINASGYVYGPSAWLFYSDNDPILLLWTNSGVDYVAYRNDTGAAHIMTGGSSSNIDLTLKAAGTGDVVIRDAVDATKRALLDASGITTSTDRTFAFPDASGTFALTSDLSSYVAKSLFDANTILYATSDDTPAALTVAANSLVGRAAGNIDSLIYTDVTEEGTPEAGDWILGWLATGELRKYDVDNIGGGTGDVAWGDPTTNYIVVGDGTAVEEHASVILKDAVGTTVDIDYPSASDTKIAFTNSGAGAIDVDAGRKLYCGELNTSDVYSPAQNFVVDFDDALAHEMQLVNTTGGAGTANMDIDGNLDVHNGIDLDGDNLTLADTIMAVFGSGGASDSTISWQTTTTERLVISTKVTTAGYICIVEEGEEDAALRRPSSGVAQPTLRIYNAGSTDATDYVELSCGGTTATLKTGDGDLDINVYKTTADSTLAIKNTDGTYACNLTVDGDIQAGQTIGYDNMVTVSTNGASTALDWRDGSFQQITLDESVTVQFTDPPYPCATHLFVTQDATGGYTIAFDDVDYWIDGGTTPVATSSASAKDLFTFVWKGSPGSLVCYGVHSTNFAAPS